MQYLKMDFSKRVVAWSLKCGATSIRTELFLEIAKNLNIPVPENLSSIQIKLDEILRIQKNNPNATREELYLEPINISAYKNYKFDWYVKDPYHRILSFFIDKKDWFHQEVTFRDFVFNIENNNLFKNNIYKIKTAKHLQLQSNNFLEANWNVINIEKNNNLKFKLNASNYELEFKKNAFNISLESLFQHNKTYSKKSFYSKEIYDKVKSIFSKDYELLSRFNVEIVSF